MKIFKFAFSSIAKILMFIALILTTLGGVWNIFNIIAYTSYAIVNWVKIGGYILLIVFDLCLLILVVCIMSNSKYTIDNEKLVLKYGFITSKILIKEIIAITHFKISNKLVVYLQTGKFTVINIDKNLYEDFVVSVREHNRAIIYNSKTDGEDTPE